MYAPVVSPPDDGSVTDSVGDAVRFFAHGREMTVVVKCEVIVPAGDHWFYRLAPGRISPA